jgi:hypothetical protein
MTLETAEDQGRSTDEEQDESAKDQDKSPKGQDAGEQDQERDSDQEEQDRRPKEHPRFEVIETGVVQLAALIGREPDSVSGFGRSYDDEGWRLTLEVVEMERIPESTSVMASYEAELDDDGNLLEYRQTRRYYRNQSWEQ